MSHPWFADDIILVSNNMKELQEMLTELNNVSQTVGLHMNFKKTKVMVNESE